MNTAELDRRMLEDRERILRDWDADRRPVHCANCRFAVVGGRPDEPTVRCAKGHGAKRLDLFVLLRKRAPRQFVPAAKCSDFDSMSDGNPWE